MRTKRNPEPPALTFRGLDLCDGCGAKLDPGDRLSGLCRACQDTIREGPLPSIGRRKTRNVGQRGASEGPER